MLLSEPIFDQQPAFPSAHCATIVELPAGDLLVAWFAGSYELAPDVAILCSRWEHRMRRWTPPQVLVNTPGHAEGQPVLFLAPDGVLWLFYVTVQEQDWTSALMKVRRSRDNGLTWSASQVFRPELGLMFRSRPLVLDNGDILLPIYDEKTWQSLFMLSSDGGRTWSTHGPITTPAGNIHPVVVPLSDGRLLCYMRTGGSGGYIWASTSEDGGRTWSTPWATQLPNPNSGIDLIRLKSGELLLAFNDTFRGRTPLNVALSTDEGRTWSYEQVIEDAEGEYSYPALLQTHDGLIHLVYTNNRVNIKHVVFTVDWVKARPVPPRRG